MGGDPGSLTGLSVVHLEQESKSKFLGERWELVGDGGECRRRVLSARREEDMGEINNVRAPVFCKTI